MPWLRRKSEESQGGELQASHSTLHGTASGPPAWGYLHLVGKPPLFPSCSPGSGCSHFWPPVLLTLHCASEPKQRAWGWSWLLPLPAPSCPRPSQKNIVGNGQRSDTDPLSFTTPSAFDVNTEFMCWVDTKKVTDQGNNK